MTESFYDRIIFDDFEQDVLLVEVDPMNAIQSGVHKEPANVPFIRSKVRFHGGHVPCTVGIEQAHLL